MLFFGRKFILTKLFIFIQNFCFFDKIFFLFFCKTFIWQNFIYQTSFGETSFGETLFANIIWRGLPAPILSLASLNLWLPIVPIYLQMFHMFQYFQLFQMFQKYRAHWGWNENQFNCSMLFIYFWHTQQHKWIRLIDIYNKTRRWPYKMLGISLSVTFTMTFKCRVLVCGHNSMVLAIYMCRLHVLQPIK